MRLANDHMQEYLPLGSFVTMVTVRIQPDTGGVEFCNAGHPPIATISPDGSIREIRNVDESGFNLPLALGCEAMTTGSFDLRPGEVLALYTDGLTDLQNDRGEQLGSEELLRILRNSAIRNAAAPLDRTMTDLRQSMEQYRGSQTPPDDQTLLLCRRKL